MVSKAKKNIKLSSINNDKEEKKKRRETLLPKPMPIGTPNKHLLDALKEETPFASKMSHEEFSRNYDSWMKIAADNKINVNNSWSVQLIDYFHDLSLMKEGDSINFQKASCTLDGCVKVYTTRVDAVASETTKLLTGLTEVNSKKKHVQESENPDEDDDAVETKRATKKSSKANTIEKNPQSLKVKKFDLEFTIDPLFKKISTSFDEGCAGGLLLNHLSINKHVQLVLDASEPLYLADSQEDAEELEMLSEKFDMSLIFEKHGHLLRNIKERSLCPSLANFAFSDPSSGLSDEFQLDLNVDMLAADIEAMQMSDIGSTQQPIDNPFENDHQFDIDPAQMAGFDDDYGGDDTPAAPFEPFLDDVRRESQRIEKSALIASLDTPVYSYFDETNLRNWAGPLHWKLRRPQNIQPTAASAAEPKARKERQQFFIDFNGPAVDEKTLFASDSKKTTLLSKQKEDPRKNLLPLDIHYTLKDLNKFFLKPKFSLKQNVTAASTSNQDIPNPFVDNQGEQALQPPVDFNPFDMNNDYQPMNEPMVQDDAHGYDTDEGDGFVSSQPFSAAFDSQMVDSSQMRSDALNYTKRAKRVDIKKLKDNIWDALAHEEPKPSDVVKFSSVVSEVKHMYQPEKAKDISVSFYFICLLHLANEKNLKIDGEGQDLVIVGE